MAKHDFQCGHCHKSYSTGENEEAIPEFCPFCNHRIKIEQSNEETIGAFKLLNRIGQGGMGEVYLAYDTSCGRQIALKRIRSDLLKYPQIRNRFLKEARITALLTHPAIIPIYTIQSHPDLTYYTMPFVEGETLKQLLKKARSQEKKRDKREALSIPSLIRIFIPVCQAIAYAHAKNVIHRDIKPENIIIGKYGEVLILDWGLAKFLEGTEPSKNSSLDEVISNNKGGVTQVGKIVGTLSYMAPEIAVGQPATIQTDIYALGVILYQFLTLHFPFKRGNLKEFKKNHPKEELIEPIIAAPYRDIPRILSQITKKCLEISPNNRYQKVDDLIQDIENYLEGRSEWFHAAELDTHQKSDWEFQENVLLAEQMAIANIAEKAEWVSLMISKASFNGNIKIETTIVLQEDSQGIGFLISVPEASERLYVNDGYCLWLGTDHRKPTHLLRSNVEVVHAPDVTLKREQEVKVRIEKIDQTLHVYIDDKLQMSYIAHIPLIGTHVGVISRDANHEMKPLEVSVGSLNINVTCLAVPDAFLAHNDYEKALSEYRRIAYSFPDRTEGREALFRAGLTILEKAKDLIGSEKEESLNIALEEFEKLHGTPGAPLEYLGKALIYQTMQDYGEELKCFELAFRRYSKHPLLSVLQEQIISRMHELSRFNRIAAYGFVLLAARHFPWNAIDSHTQRLFNSLQKHWEILYFIEDNPLKDKESSRFHFIIQLAFWLAQPYILGEIIEEMVSNPQPAFNTEIVNAFFSLIELGSWQYAKKKLHSLPEELLTPSQIKALERALSAFEKPLPEAIKEYPIDPSLPQTEFNSWLCLLNRALDQQEPATIEPILAELRTHTLTPQHLLQLDTIEIRKSLLKKEWDNASHIFQQYPFELLNKESTPLHFLYGCWLQAIEGKEVANIHFGGVLNTAYPRSWTLGSHYLIGDLNLNSIWFSQAFLWEKRQLFRQLFLYYSCLHQNDVAKTFHQLFKQQFIYAAP